MVDIKSGTKLYKMCLGCVLVQRKPSEITHDFNRTKEPMERGSGGTDWVLKIIMTPSDRSLWKNQWAYKDA